MSIYLPFAPIKGSPGQPDYGFPIWQTLRLNFDPKETLSKFNLTINEITNWRTQITAETRNIYPLKEWYLLVRHTNYIKRHERTLTFVKIEDTFTEMFPLVETSPVIPNNFRKLTYHLYMKTLIKIQNECRTIS